MCFEYQNFFDSCNLKSLKIFLRDNSTKTIYTDHFTKYSVDLIRGYELNNSERILGDDFDFNQLESGDWILYNKKHIAELKLQHYPFPEFTVLGSNQYRKVASFNEFIFYEKLP
jgi:hypothetical protein